MNIEKEREAFGDNFRKTEIYRRECAIRGKDILEFSKTMGAYFNIVTNDAWNMWQAAKAQAVPEGFKVVSFKQISELVVAVNKVDLMTHTEQKTNEVRLAWQDIASKLQAMIEAQEQNQ